MQRQPSGPIVRDAQACRGFKVAVLTNAVLSYRRPVFEALQKTPGICLRLFLSLPCEMSDQRARTTLAMTHSRGLNLKWRTRHPHLATSYTEALHIPLALIFDLLRYRPDLIISGEFGLRSLVAYWVARSCRIPLLLWTEEIAERAKSISASQKRLRAFLIPRATSLLAWGEPAVRYLRSFGVADEKIHYCAQAVDNEAWARECARYDRQRVREELGVRGKTFLTVGRLVEGKGLRHLLLAWSLLPADARENNTLMIVGGGPEGAALREIARANDLKTVLFAGPHSGATLAKYYAAADIFVFPSLVDVWGLVVNEAMACGLPVLASRFAGASQQLVDDNDVGEMFDPTDVDAFASLLRQWAVRAEPIPRERPMAVVSALSFDVTIQALRRAITLCANAQAAPLGSPFK